MNKYKKGFTLVEAMIVLIIIGVIAALTIPSVIVNSRERATITSYKKAVKTLNDAISANLGLYGRGPADTVEPNSHDDDRGGEIVSTENNLVEQFIARIKVVEKGFLNDWCEVINTQNGVAVRTIEEADGGCNFITADGVQFIQISQLNGTDFHTFECSKNNPCLMVVDINGVEGPNSFADDIDSTNIRGNMKDRFLIEITDRFAKPHSVFDQAVFDAIK